MGWLYTIVIGLIIGLVARLLKPGADGLGWIMTILVGIGGSLLATAAGQMLGIYQAGAVAGFIASVIGAIVLLFIVQMIRRK